MRPVIVSESSDTLEFATVTAGKGYTTSIKDNIFLKGCMRAEDALMRTPELFVNDMGGAGGLKTVSLRGLGSAHTSIYVDGVRIGNLMSGQNDLSMFSTGNFSKVEVDYAQNSVSFISSPIEFSDKRRYTASASFNGGSFSTYMPSLSFGWKISDNMTSQIHVSSTISDGHRANSGIEQYSGGIDIRGKHAKGLWKAKAYMNFSDRDCPGSVIYPDPSRQRDLNYFIQGSLHQNFSNTYALDMSAKVSHDFMNYNDSWSQAEYRQTEIQINTSHLFSVTDWCRLSFSASGIWDGLKSSNYSISIGADTPQIISRFGATTSGAASFRHDRVKAELNIEYTGAYDRGDGFSADRHCFSPAASIRFTIIDGLDLTAFGRRSCHIPTFNDLYYINSGNARLKPEYAWMTDAGIEWKKSIGAHWRMMAKADGFFNFLTDKIAWSPTPENPSIWLPFNISKVRSSGGDVNLSATYSDAEWEGGISARYSLQDVRDRTSDSHDFNSQIAYIPRHTLILLGNVRYRGWRIEAVWNLRDGRKDSFGAMPAWNTLDISADKSIMIKNICEMTFSLTAKNITDNRYEISSGYPMPGWGLYGGITVKL